MAPASTPSADDPLSIRAAGSVYPAHRTSHLAMMLVVLAMATASFIGGERVQAGGGLGWDGVTYAGLVRSLDQIVTRGELGTYYGQRILPAAVVRASLLLTRQPFTDANIIRNFELYNAVLAVGTTFLWRRVADRLDFGFAARWVGFSALFVTYAFSKQNFFAPVLTDPTAYFSAMLLLLLTIEKRRLPLLVTTVFGAFCWPMAAPSGGVLLLMLHVPEDKVWECIPGDRPFAFAGRRSTALLCLLAVAIYLIAASAAATDVACPEMQRGFVWVVSKLPPAFAIKLGRADPCTTFAGAVTAVPAVLLFGSAAVWLGCSGLRVKVIAREIRRIPAGDLIASATALLLPWLGVRLLTNPVLPNVSSPILLARLALSPPPGLVLMPLVSLAVFWGPMLLLLAMHWRDLTIGARQLGTGIVALLCLNIPFGVVGEPRFITMAWPFLVTALCCAMNGRPPSPRFGWTFAALSVMFAQFWLPLNYARWTGGDLDDLLVMPKQLHFMHYGLWMSGSSYVWQTLALFIAGTLLWWTSPFRPTRSAEGADLSEVNPTSA